MARKPAEPRRGRDAQAGARVDAGEPAREEAREDTEPPAGRAHDGEPERSGPLAVERSAKADGRALILYSDTREDRGT